MAKANTKEHTLKQGETLVVRFGDAVYNFKGGDGRLLVATDAAIEFSPANINTPKTSTAIAAAQKAYKIGEQLADGSIYVGLSAMSGKSLVTTAEDIGVYNHREAVRVVAELNRHGGGGWRLPTGHWNDKGDELNGNLFENRNKGALAGTFNLTGAAPAGYYWAAEHQYLLAACQQFSGGVRHYYGRFTRSSVRPVREWSSPQKLVTHPL